MRKHLLIGGVAALALITASCGSGESASSGKPKESITIKMTDNAYSQKVLQVTAGQPVELIFSNEGKVDHEAIIGDEAMQSQHGKEMQTQANDDMGGMGHGGSMDSDALTVKPGESGSMDYTFKASDDGLIIGCHVPGHYESGMKMAVSVKA